MMKIIKMIIRNVKKLICIGITIEIICYLYCLPIGITELVLYVIKNIVLSLVFLLMIHAAHLNNATGATKLFSKIKLAKYTEFSVILLTLLAALLGFIIMLKTKEFDNSCLIVPSIVGLYSASKATCIYDAELKKTRST